MEEHPPIILPNKDLVEFYESSFSSDLLLNQKRYSNERFIANGAIKRIYKATDNHCGRDVAIARIKEDVFSPENALDFVREVQLTSSLEHPNIIRIYDIGITDGSPWFTMELTSGRTLNDKLKQSPKLTLYDKLDIFIQLCDAIAYAHDRDILHLDLKPENITLGKHDQILLCDWGISSSISVLPENDLIKTQTLYGYIKGSPGYMPPEQAQAQYVKHITADVFGLGAILYFMLTGKTPIDGNTPEELLRNTRQGKLRSVIHPDIPERLRPLISKALATPPEERYQSAGDLQHEIEQYRSGFATFAEDASVFTQIRLFYHRNKLICSTLLVSLIILIFLTVYYVNSIKISEANAHMAQNQAEISLNQYLQEQEARRQTNQSFSQILVLHNRANLQAFKHAEALNNAQAAVLLDPYNKEAMMQLGFTYFACFKFEQAIKYLRAVDHQETKNLLPIAEVYATKNLSFTAQETIELLQQLPKYRVNLRHYMLYSHSTLHPPEEHCHLVAHMLARRNDLDQITYQYDPESQTLDLTGNLGLNNLKSQKNNLIPSVNLLRTLPIKRLILDDSEAHRANKTTISQELRCQITLEAAKVSH